MHPRMSKSQFDENISNLLDLVCHDVVKEFMVSDSNEHHDQQSLLMSLVHNNWKKAQKEISELLLDIYDERKEIDHKIAENNKNKQKDKSSELKTINKTLRFRARKLRNIFNVIPWIMLGANDYMPKRFWRNSSDNINRKTIAEIFQFIDLINQDKNSLAILNDLSTFLHVGDSLVLKDNKISLVEVKTGAKNAELLNILMRNNMEELSQLDEKDKEQINRINKQKVSMNKVQEVIHKDEGEHLYYKTPVFQLENDTNIDYFTMQLNEAYKELNNSDWVIGIIDNCLYFGMYKGEFLKYGTFPINSWMEAEKVDGITFCYNSIFLQDLGTPVGASGLSSELVKDIFTDRVVIYFHLDVLKLLSIGNQMGIPYSLLKKTKHNAPFNKMESSEYKNQYIAITVTHNGKEQKIIMGGGFFSRIIYDLQTPISVLLLNSKAMIVD